MTHLIYENIFILLLYKNLHRYRQIISLVLIPHYLSPIPLLRVIKIFRYIVCIYITCPRNMVSLAFHNVTVFSISFRVLGWTPYVNGLFLHIHNRTAYSFENVIFKSLQPAILVVVCISQLYVSVDLIIKGGYNLTCVRFEKMFWL